MCVWCARCKSEKSTVGVELNMGSERIYFSVKLKKRNILKEVGVMAK
jgi:hypothetical protein